MARRWTREYEQRVKDILASMSREAMPFDDMSAEAVSARKALPFAEWCHTYLPHWFVVADAPFHIEADARRDFRGIPMCDCWARGTAKTTRYSIGDPLHRILNGTDCFGVLGAKTVDSAAEKSDMIRVELKHNLRLRADYGESIAPSTGDDEEVDWIACGCRVRCLGTGQSLRGAVHNGHRPQFFIGDDLEDKRIARSRDQEQKLWDWLMGDVYPALEGQGQDAVFRNLCNMYGRHCLAIRFKAMADQVDAQGRALAIYRNHPILDDDGESAWPARYTTDQVKRAMAIIGTRLARTEYLCLMADDEAPYQPDWFKSFDTRLLTAEQIGAMKKVAYLDPSATAKETSDYKAWIVLGRIGNEPEVYCLHAWLRRATPAEMLREMFTILDKFPGVALAGERNGFQSLIWDLLVAMCQRDGRPVPYIAGVLNTSNKLDRMLQWQAEFQLGHCLFDGREGDQQRLIDQFCDLPTGKHDDGPDAWDGARRLLGAPRKPAAPYREPTRADALAEAGIDHWNAPDNPAIWQEASW